MTADIVRGFLSEAEQAAIERMHGSGRQAAEIARTLNRHRSTVYGWMRNNNLLEQVKHRRVSFQRFGAPVRAFTPDEDAFIENLRAEGVTAKRIAELAAERFGYRRQPHTILMRLRLLAMRDCADD